MRIGIEVSVLQTSRAGSAVYTRNLLTHLQAIAPRHRFVPYRFGAARRPGFRRRLESVLRDTVWMHLALPLRVWRDRVDVFHAPAYTVPLALPCPSVLTVHDLTIVKFPEWFDHPWFRVYARAMLPILVRRVARVVTVSQFSKRDLMKCYGLPDEKIRVIPNAVDHRLFHVRYDPQAVRAAVQRFGIGGEYILSVGTLEPRKNLTRLVQAFARLRARGVDDHRLVVVGEKGWKYEAIFEAVRTLGLEGEVRFLGRVPQSDLPLLYRGAALFAYPSLYEGFGLPVLEAMACGCPVVCSDRSAMPEVGGPAAILVDPEDPEALAGAMSQVLGDRSLADAMRARGRTWAAEFHWEKAARALLALYEECAR
jgi:glycosyltransferase involved in cell wall biosynthesis